jgi:hypothetical protein
MPSIARQMSVCGLLSCALLGAAHVHAAPTLLGFYTFENTNGSFANVTDVSGNNKNPVSVASNGSVTVTTGGQGYQGEAARFAPTSGNMPNSGFEVNIDIAPSQGDLTVGGWIKLDLTSAPSPGFQRSFFGHDNGCWDRGLWYGDTGWEITGKANCAGPTKTSVTMPFNEWQFVAVSFSGTNATLYINGEQKATAPSFDSQSGSYGVGGSPRLRFGAFDGDSGTEPWKGWMDNLFVFRGALDATQMRSINSLGADGVLQVAGLQQGSVPVPGTLGLLGAAGLAFAIARRQRKAA